MPSRMLDLKSSRNLKSPSRTISVPLRLPGTSKAPFVSNQEQFMLDGRNLEPYRWVLEIIFMDSQKLFKHPWNFFKVNSVRHKDHKTPQEPFVSLKDLIKKLLILSRSPGRTSRTIFDYLGPLKHHLCPLQDPWSLFKDPLTSLKEPLSRTLGNHQQSLESSLNQTTGRHSNRGVNLTLIVLCLFTCVRYVVWRGGRGVVLRCVWLRLCERLHLLSTHMNVHLQRKLWDTVDNKTTICLNLIDYVVQQKRSMWQMWESV